MPQLPQYNSQRQITTQANAPLESGAVERSQAIVGPLVKAGGEIAQKWQDATDTMQYTTAKANYQTGLVEIEARAASDTDINNYPKYAEEIRKLKQENLKGFSNKLIEQKAALEFDTSSKIANIKLNALFKKKQIEVNNVNIERLITNAKERIYNASSPVEEEQIKQEIQEVLSSNISKGLISQADGEEIWDKTREDIRKGIVARDISNDPEETLKELKKGEEGLYPDLTAKERRDYLDSAIGAIADQKKEKRRLRSQAQIDNRDDIISKIASGDIQQKDFPEIINKFAGKDEKLQLALQRNLKGQQIELTKEDDQAFMGLAIKMFESDKPDDVSNFLVDALENPNISRNRLASLVYAARLRGEEIAGNNKFLSNVWNGIRDYFIGNINKAQETMINIMNKFSKEKKTLEDLPVVADEALRQERIKEYPWIQNLPKEGEIRIFPDGAKRKIYPDGRIEDVK